MLTRYFYFYYIVWGKTSYVWWLVIDEKRTSNMRIHIHLFWQRARIFDMFSHIIFHWQNGEKGRGKYIRRERGEWSQSRITKRGPPELILPPPPPPPSPPRRFFLTLRLRVGHLSFSPTSSSKPPWGCTRSSFSTLSSSPFLVRAERWLNQEPENTSSLSFTREQCLSL